MNKQTHTHIKRAYRSHRLIETLDRPATTLSRRSSNNPSSLGQDERSPIATEADHANSEANRDAVPTVPQEHEKSVIDALQKIEEFVKAIEKTDELGFVIETNRHGGKKAAKLDIATKFHRHIGDMLAAVRPGCWYAPPIQAFFDASSDMGIIGDKDFQYSQVNGMYGWTGKTHADILNELIDRIRKRCQTHEYRKQIRNREANARRNIETGLAFEEKMFQWRSRHLILSLTLGIKPEHRDGVTLDNMRRFRDRFLKDRRMNALLRGINGYIWKIEFGEISGLHMHVIIFYTSASRRDIYFAKMLGEYWEHAVTKGIGSYWNSNAQKDFHRKHGHGVGTGQINDGSPEQISLRKNIEYLAKADQYLLEKGNVNVHVFGTSQVPKRLASGRPRTSTACAGNVVNPANRVGEVQCAERLPWEQ